MRHHELLGNFEKALFYLDKFVEAYPLIGKMDEATKKRVEKLRALYKAQNSEKTRKAEKAEKTEAKRL